MGNMDGKWAIWVAWGYGWGFEDTDGVADMVWGGVGQGSHSLTKSYILMQNAKSFLSILHTISYFLVQLLYSEHLSDTCYLFQF